MGGYDNVGFHLENDKYIESRIPVPGEGDERAPPSCAGGSLMPGQPRRELVDGSAPATPEELLAQLRTMGIEAETLTHPPVFTVEEAKRHRGEVPGAHVKNLFVRDKKGIMWLIVALEDRPVDLRTLAESLGHKRFSFGSERRLMEYLGVVPGAVTLFAVVNDHGGAVKVALDSGLRAHELWSFHPLDNAMTTTVRAVDMLRFLDEVDHPPTWVELGGS
jgi:Ala-tRNA(Pro) deacylase